MANHAVTVLNPTPSPVTVGSNTVPPGLIAHLLLSDATADAYGWSDSGCVLSSTTSPGVVKCPVCQFQTKLGQVLEPSYLPQQPGG